MKRLAGSGRQCLLYQVECALQIGAPDLAPIAGYEAIKSRGSSARIHDPSIAQQMAAMSTLDLAREKSTLAVSSARLADLRRH